MQNLYSIRAYYGGGQVVRILAFYSNNPSSNPAEVNNFYRVKIAWLEQR